MIFLVLKIIIILNLAGFMVQYIGGKWTFASGICVCAFICLLIPTLVQAGGFLTFLILRILQGLSQVNYI